jgi:hypothetical protein
LAKAEYRCKLGLINEAVIIADEAVQAELVTHLDNLKIPHQNDREEASQVLQQEGLATSVKNLLRLSDLRKIAEKIADQEILSESDAEEAIAIAENAVTEISEKDERQVAREKGSEFTLPIEATNPWQPRRVRYEDGGQSETEFVTKLLLAKAVLSSSKKRIPRFIGLIIIIMSSLTCLFLGLRGGSGIIMAFTGNTPFSIFEILIDFVFLLIAYFLLKMVVYVKGETR